MFTLRASRAKGEVFAALQPNRVLETVDSACQARYNSTGLFRKIELKKSFARGNFTYASY